MAIHAQLISHQPNFAVKPTPTNFACRFPACYALRCGLPVALGFSLKNTGLLQCLNFAPTASAATRIFLRSQRRLASAPLNARSVSLALRTHCRATVPIAAANSLHVRGALPQSLLHTPLQLSESSNRMAAAKQHEARQQVCFSPLRGKSRSTMAAISSREWSCNSQVNSWPNHAGLNPPPLRSPA